MDLKAPCELWHLELLELYIISLNYLTSWDFLPIFSMFFFM